MFDLQWRSGLVESVGKAGYVPQGPASRISQEPVVESVKMLINPQCLTKTTRLASSTKYSLLEQGKIVVLRISPFTS